MTVLTSLARGCAFLALTDTARQRLWHGELKEGRLLYGYEFEVVYTAACLDEAATQARLYFKEPR